MPQSKAQIRATAKYKAQMVVRFGLDCNKVNDADIIARMIAEPNKQGYLKALIRADIAAKKTQAGE